MIARSIACVWISVALFILALFVVLRVVVMRSFADLEARDATSNVARVLNAITERETNLSSKAFDWAAWDDAYEFMQDGNSRFIRSNFALSAFTGFNLCLIAYVHNSGEIAYARWYQPGTDRLVPLPDEVRRAILRKGVLISHRDVHGSKHGIVMLKQGPMLVASRPVVTSYQEGPIRGAVIFGQLLGSEEVRSIARLTDLRIAIARLDAGPLPKDFAKARKRLTSSRQVVVEPISRCVVAGYAMLNDICGHPALMVQVQQPRTIYKRGLALSSYTLAALVVLTVVFGSVVTVLLVRTVRKEHEFDLSTLEFYRRTVTAATGGKLIITEPVEIDRLSVTPIARWSVRTPTDIAEVRNGVVAASISSGMDEDRAWMFATCVGEAVTNAIKHAAGGTASLHRLSESLLFVVTDHGPGISALTIPDVALRRGYSTAGTLGMGYKVMISLGDRVYLATGPGGTTVAIEMLLRPQECSVDGLGLISSLD